MEFLRTTIDFTRLGVEKRFLPLASRRIFGSEQDHNFCIDNIARTIFFEFPSARSGTLAVIHLSELEGHKLSTDERKGLLFFATLILEADRVLDESPELKCISDQVLLKERILRGQTKYLGMSIGELMQQAFFYFPYSKQDIIKSYLAFMIEIHAKQGPAIPGEYGAKDALYYKNTTNNASIDVVCKFGEVLDPSHVRLIKSIAFLSQVRNDRKDWPLDWKEESVNILIGLAHDNGELSKMQSYVDNPPKTDRGPKGPIPNAPWMKENIPLTYNDYNEIRKKEAERLNNSFLKWYQRIFGRIPL